MCSRYNLTSPPEAVRAYFNVAKCEPFPPRYNIAPTQPVLIARRGHGGERELCLVRWGLIPGWAKNLEKFSTLINARAETLTEKPSFRGPLRHKRCLIPADGFYEWTGKPGNKQPHLIRPRGGGLMAFAGLYEEWLGPDGSEIDSMAIITVPANAAVRPIHDRMPAILPSEHFDAWLDVRAVDTPFAVPLLSPARDDLLEIVEVSRRLNNPRNDGPELLLPDRPALL
ncbi:MAG: SOS response-associated peptidase [Hyphomicrobiaceae bacterium]|nr:SOS response-associated peptidase [Hyphomicrobiaceae bacterium]